MSKEIWRDIAGYEGLYQISNYGNAKSLLFRNNIARFEREKIMTPTDNGNGYLIISLKLDGKRVNKYIHRLVAEAFVSNPNNKKYVNHIDFNKKNNTFSNLEWCTQKENINHSKDKMRHPKLIIPKRTGYKYITIRNGRCRLHIRGLCDKTFKDFSEAMTVRNRLLYERYGIDMLLNIVKLESYSTNLQSKFLL